MYLLNMDNWYFLKSHLYNCISLNYYKAVKCSGAIILGPYIVGVDKVSGKLGVDKNYI